MTGIARIGLGFVPVHASLESAQITRLCKSHIALPAGKLSNTCVYCRVLFEVALRLELLAFRARVRPLLAVSFQMRAQVHQFGKVFAADVARESLSSHRMATHVRSHVVDFSETPIAMTAFVRSLSGVGSRMLSQVVFRVKALLALLAAEQPLVRVIFYVLHQFPLLPK